MQIKRSLYQKKIPRMIKTPLKKILIDLVPILSNKKLYFFGNITLRSQFSPTPEDNH